MTILFSTNIGGIEIKLTRTAGEYAVTRETEHWAASLRVQTYAEASAALGNYIAHAIEQLHGPENLP